MKYLDDGIYREVFGKLTKVNLLQDLPFKSDVFADPGKTVSMLLSNQCSLHSIIARKVNVIYDENIKYLERYINSARTKPYTNEYNCAIEFESNKNKLLKCIYEENQKGIQQYNELIFGKYSLGNFLWVYLQIRNSVDFTKVKHLVNIDYLDQLLLENSTLLEEIDRLVTSNLDSNDHLKLLELTNLIIPNLEREEYNSLEIKSVFEEVLRNNGIEYNVAITQSLASLTVTKKAIFVPEHRVIKRDKLKKLIVHEIGVHVQRNIRLHQTSKLKVFNRYPK